MSNPEKILCVYVVSDAHGPTKVSGHTHYEEAKRVLDETRARLSSRPGFTAEFRWEYWDGSTLIRTESYP